MKKHNGMRPHDVAVLLKIASLHDQNWLMKDLAGSLGISNSEISESINRSIYAGLISDDKRTIMKQSLLEFLEFGLKYIYPQNPGAIVRGVPTAYSAPPLDKLIVSGDPLVWPYAEGKSRGQGIIPLHPKVPKVCQLDKSLYELLALTDALRVGKLRERKMAMEEIRKRI